jgi:hypothetical protein
MYACFVQPPVAPLLLAGVIVCEVDMMVPQLGCLHHKAVKANTAKWVDSTCPL